MAKKRRTKRRTKRGTKRGKPRRSGGAQKTLRMLIVEARFYEDIADALLRGARAVLDAADAEYDTLSVPGSLEIPPAIAMALDAAAAKKRPYHGVIALGCVIRGDTFHFEVVANESGRGLMDLALRERVALGNGILTVNTEAQAHARSGKATNKGADAARAALDMARLKRDLGA